ncbi:MAG TPA: hypothetical protein VIG35_09520 [Gaiellaceae bacterium]|jgi:hypothetical protein
MPSASSDDIDLQEIAPGYSSRFADWGGITVAFEKAHAGQDASAMVRGLPDDRCQAPHWGYLFSGKIVVHYKDRSETVEGGQAYYIEPGHAIEFLEDSEALEFTPTEALEQTFAAVRRNAAEPGS